MNGVTCFDTITNSEYPPGLAAAAAYVDGHIGDQPNFAYIVREFPKAQHISITLLDGDALAADVENGAMTPAEVPGWHARQVARGIARPIVYASTYTMQEQILPALVRAGISLSSTRLWTAHYGLGEHICGPASCGALSVNADGTQWTSSAMGLVLDQSLLVADFFTGTANNPTVTEAELQSGQLNNGKNAHTAIAVPPGTAHQIAFGCDNGVQGQPPARIRVAIYGPGPGWHVTKDLVVNGTKGLTHLAFPDPSKTGVISINRADAGVTNVGYVIY